MIRDDECVFYNNPVTLMSGFPTIPGFRTFGVQDAERPSRTTCRLFGSRGRDWFGLSSAIEYPKHRQRRLGLRCGITAYPFVGNRRHTQ
jgi:hypothetical protein